MTLVTAIGVGKTFGTQLCFQDAKFTISAETRAGLIGRNGTGKSTLLHIIRGALEHEGTVSRRSDIRIGMLEQNPELPPGATVREAMLAAASAVSEMEKEMRRIHEKLAADPDDSAGLLERLSELEGLFEREGGYVIENRVEQILEGVGFPKVRFGDLVDKLSGGERNRLALGRLLLVEPDLWLLDEPTNHLDLDGITFLEGFLRESRAAAVIVSHDRRFLDPGRSKRGGFIPIRRRTRARGRCGRSGSRRSGASTKSRRSSSRRKKTLSAASRRGSGRRRRRGGRSDWRGSNAWRNRPSRRGR
jgi:ATP-binding cassette subfamily F protein 3